MIYETKDSGCTPGANENDIFVDTADGSIWLSQRGSGMDRDDMIKVTSAIDAELLIEAIRHMSPSIFGAKDEVTA